MRHHLVIALLVAQLLVLAAIARADTAPLALRGSFTAGGGALSAGGYTLAGAIGQPLAGTIQAGGYLLTSGVIVAGAPPPEIERRVYLPIVRR